MRGGGGGCAGHPAGGGASYFGVWQEKPTIGDGTRPAEPEDIRRVCRMLYAGSVLCLLVLCGLRLAALALG